MPSPEDASTVSRRLTSGSRRRLIGGGLAAAVAAGTTRIPPLAAGAQDDAEADFALLNFLLSVEHLEVALMEQGLADFGPADWRAAGVGQEARLDLEEVRDQDQAHLAALADAIAAAGGIPVDPVPYAFGYDDSLSFLRVAAGVAQTVVAAYAGAIPLVADASLSTTLLGVHSVEGRHAAFLKINSAQSPFPDPIDQPLTRDEVLAIIAGYTGGGTDEPTVGDDVEPVDPVEPVADARNVFAAVIADAAARLGVPEEEIEIVEVTERQWPTSALGCPEPGAFYAEVITPGYLVILDAAGRTLEYHTDEGDAFVLCG